MRCADFAPTPGRRRSASSKSCSARSVTAKASAWVLEGELHARDLRHAGAELAHLLLRCGLGAPDRIVERCGDQVFHHVLVVGEQARVDADALDVVPAGHRDLHQAGTGDTLDLDRRQFLLRLAQIVLHRLRLLHQAGQLILHHGEGFLCTGLIDPGTMRAVLNCDISSRTTGSVVMVCSACRCARSRAAASRRAGVSLGTPSTSSSSTAEPCTAMTAACSLSRSTAV